jgi:hypothetical protein
METAINNAKNSATLSTNTATALPTNLSAHQKRASISGGTSKPTTNDASLDGSTIKKSSSTSEGLLLQRAALTPQTNGAFGHKENNNSTNKSESKTSLTGEKRVDVSRSAAGNETHQEKSKFHSFSRRI